MQEENLLCLALTVFPKICFFFAVDAKDEDEDEDDSPGLFLFLFVNDVVSSSTVVVCAVAPDCVSLVSAAARLGTNATKLIVWCMQKAILVRI